MNDKDLENFGKFELSNEKLVFGQLKLAGNTTRLELQDDTPFTKADIDRTFLHGTLNDFRKVTLLDCVQMGSAVKSLDKSSSHHASIVPHYVLLGDRHVHPEELAVSSVSFSIGDAWTLFHDLKAFGFDRNAKQHIAEVAGIGKKGKATLAGDDPRIVYFTGRTSIADVSTVNGTVCVKHCPGWDMGGAHGIRIDNTIFISIAFENLLTVEMATQRLIQLLRFLELVIGRAQELTNVYLQLGEAGSRPLEFRWTFPPSRQMQGGRIPHSFDVLLNPISEPDVFAKVMQNWLASDEERGDARSRLLTSFRNQNEYDTDRLIRAANMFDILPASAFAVDVELSLELIDAKRQSRELFCKLPASLEREAMLNALGRIGKPSLKHKVLSRGRFLIGGMSDTFPELEMVLVAAVDCRNHYVHGSPSKIDYRQKSDTTGFLTDALEFVFVVSDLKDMGWNPYAYIDKYTTMSHTLGAFRVDYAERLHSLKSLTAKGL